MSTVHMCLYCSYVLIRVFYYIIYFLPISINSYKPKHTLVSTVCTASDAVISTFVWMFLDGVIFHFAHFSLAYVKTVTGQDCKSVQHWSRAHHSAIFIWIASTQNPVKQPCNKSLQLQPVFVRLYPTPETNWSFTLP